MTTLVERLRSANATGGVADKYNEAADRIEELERKVIGRDLEIDQLREMIRDGDAQIALLREALKEVAWSNNSLWQRDRAKVALAATEEKK